MKTKNENFAKKIKFEKMKIATLSKQEKQQVKGGSDPIFSSLIACEPEDDC